MLIQLFNFVEKKQITDKTIFIHNANFRALRNIKKRKIFFVVVVSHNCFFLDQADEKNMQSLNSEENIMESPCNMQF